MRRQTASAKVSNIKTYRKISWFLGVIFFLLLSVKFIKAYQGVKINQQYRTTITMGDNPVLLLSISPDKEERFLVYTISQDVFMDVPFGYGKYRLGSIKRLAELEKKPSLFKETLTDFLGFPVDLVLDSDTDKNDFTISSVKSHFHPFKLFFQNNELNVVDKFRLVRLIWLAPDNKFNIRDTQNLESIFPEYQNEDGVTYKKYNQSAWEELNHEEVVDPTIRKNAATLVVFNATKVSGAAAKFGRFVTKIGGDVLRYDNIDKIVENCDIRTTPEYINSKIVLYLQHIFDCSVSEVSEVHSAHIDVYVGDVFAKRWSKED